MKNFWNGFLGGIIATTLICILWYGYEKYHGDEVEIIASEEEVESNHLEDPTLEQRLNDLEIDQQDYKLYDLAMQLPKETVEIILKRIGLTATYDEIAEEYLRNVNYYVSKQVASKIDTTINMPGIEDAKVSIKAYSSLKKDQPIKLSTEIDSVK